MRCLRVGAGSRVSCAACHSKCRLRCTRMRLQGITAQLPRQAVPRQQPTRSRLSVCAAATSPAGGLQALSSSQPVDRLRYQMKEVYQFFDKDKNGLLSTEELYIFEAYVLAKLSRTAESKAAVEALFKEVTSSMIVNGKENGCDYERFLAFIRQLLDIVTANGQSYMSSMYNTDQLSKLKFLAALNVKELAAVSFTFALMDFNGDGKIPADQVRRMTGIEGEIVRQKLLDEDDEDETEVEFEQFMMTYAKPRPVFLSMAVMAVHTIAIYLVLNAPVQYVIKGIFIGFMVLQPHIITNAVVYVHNIIMTVINNIRAQSELARQRPRMA